MNDRGPNMIVAALRRCLQFALFRDNWMTARELVPNFFTLLSICTALLAIRWAIEREFEWAVGAVIASVVLDGIDGRMARILHAQSKFGAEFDSLADFVAFGVAPAIILFNWGLSHLDGVGWAAVTAFAIACGVRLARFNAAIERKKLDWEENYFTGVPAPAGALLVMMPLYLDGLRSFGDPPLPGLTQMNWASYALVAYVVTVAFFMISTIPTYSGKSAGDRIVREHPMVALALATGVAFSLYSFPYATLAAGTVLYFLAMPLGIRRYIRLDRLDDEDEDLRPNLSGRSGE